MCWQFWKNDIASAADLALALRAIGAANDLTIEAGRLINYNNDDKDAVKAIEKGQRVVRLGAGACAVGHAGSGLLVDVITNPPDHALPGHGPPAG